MSRLIDADALKADYFTTTPTTGTTSTMYVSLYQILNAPTVEERKTGKWIINKGACEPDYMECSRCKWITEYYGGLEEEWDFCPHCGCEMRQEGGRP